MLYSFGLILLLANIYVCMKIIDTPALIETKVFWIGLIAIFPMIGLIAWFFAGPGEKSLPYKL